MGVSLTQTAGHLSDGRHLLQDRWVDGREVGRNDADQDVDSVLQGGTGVVAWVALGQRRHRVELHQKTETNVHYRM